MMNESGVTSHYDAVCSTITEHYTLLGVVMFVCVAGILGNSLVIIATLHSKAFSGDNTSIVFVRNLAIADLFYIFVQVIPDIIVRVHGHRWLLGNALCFVSAHAVYIPGAANISFIFSISLYRLLSCQFPLHFRDSVSIGQANVFSVIVWVWSLIPSLIYLIHRPTAQFQPISSDCGVSFPNKNMVNAIVAGPYVIIPFTGIIVCNILLFNIASKSAVRIGRSVKQASITIGAVSGLFVVSWLPYIIRQMVMIATKSEPIWPFRPDILFYELSIFGNPIIYTIVNKKFKNFLKHKILSVVMGTERMSRFFSHPSLTEVGRKKGFARDNRVSLALHQSQRGRASVMNQSNDRVDPGNQSAMTASTMLHPPHGFVIRNSLTPT